MTDNDNLNPATIPILGVEFFGGTVGQSVERMAEGGLMVVPAAPALVSLTHDEAYAEALYNADVAIGDSAYMVLLAKIMGMQCPARISGLGFLRELAESLEGDADASIFLVNPTAVEASANAEWVNASGMSVADSDCYTAPIYGDNVVDEELLRVIAEKRPKYVIICLGGGVQEKLGYYLRQNLDHKPAILCIGAAIAFLTGRQAAIPVWADKAGLGWLFRCFHEPAKFVPRYMGALRLARLMARYRTSRPMLDNDAGVKGAR